MLPNRPIRDRAICLLQLHKKTAENLGHPHPAQPVCGLGFAPVPPSGGTRVLLPRKKRNGVPSGELLPRTKSHQIKMGLFRVCGTLTHHPELNRHRNPPAGVVSAKCTFTAQASVCEPNSLRTRSLPVTVTLPSIPGVKDCLSKLLTESFKNEESTYTQTDGCCLLDEQFLLFRSYTDDDVFRARASHQKHLLPFCGYIPILHHGIYRSQDKAEKKPRHAYACWRGFFFASHAQCLRAGG